MIFTCTPSGMIDPSLIFVFKCLFSDNSVLLILKENYTKKNNIREQLNALCLISFCIPPNIKILVTNIWFTLLNNWFLQDGAKV